MRLDANEVLASNETLLRQAPMTADVYMRAAIESIDAAFGDGYAKANPQLVGAFMQTSALDFGASIVARALEKLRAEA